ncbi:toll-like receptor 4 [Bombyx mandarina]|uniref:Toll-like receptor 4 n=1 Tax=Bombyx mandarina TaxID=7092 RepID=A0A6J2K5V6_BOMMA|nr:toll-like receptor 4 [Bombyx mandarina]
MLLVHCLWLLLYNVHTSRGDLIEVYKELSHTILYPQEKSDDLPVELGQDGYSGCICRASKQNGVVVCFGNYECRMFPKVKVKCEFLRVRTTVITNIRKGHLDSLYFLKVLEIEANHQLRHIEAGVFKNLTNLQQLSISYNTHLHSINEHTFIGLVNLRNLTLVNNGFSNILAITPAFKPSILPALRGLDISENAFEIIPEDAFVPMKGTRLMKLDLNLCRLDFIHPKSFLPLKNLRELHIGENDLNSTLIGDFLLKMKDERIYLMYLDISGMGFRKNPPRDLMEIIAETSVRRLILSHNQFEFIDDDSFPKMENIELMDLRKVLAMQIGSNAFNPHKFPNLKVLLLSGNNLPGLHKAPFSDQLLFLDLSDNKGSPTNPMYYEIDRNTFVQSKELKILNLAFNRIRAIFEYTFRGLENLQILSMENGTLYHIGDKSFKPLKRLEMLNLANNPLEQNENLTSSMFDGLNDLKILILENCGIKRFYDDDNIFEMMPNLTHLVLRNNQLYYISAETLKPLKLLKVLDLSENLFVSWWQPLFLASGVKPITLNLKNNKLSHFSMSMIQDISYLLENNGNSRIEIELMDNIFICDCSSMYKMYSWLQANGSEVLRKFIQSSKFQCSSPDIWEDKRVADYLSSIKTLRCLMTEKMTNIIYLVWTAPSLVALALILFIIVFIFKFKTYIRYWMFLAKLALGRNFRRKSGKHVETKDYKYDAFISYSSEDRDFVVHMINNLELEPPFLKLCVYERDFDIGSFISEAVLKSVNESKYVILVISNGFAKSQWCRWETQLAEYHRIFLEDGTSYDPLVLVRISDVQNKYLTTTLKYLLKTKIYHTWDENNQDEFWKKLRNVLTRKI